jgi:disulfide bond formation protein DsbB
MTWAGIPWPWAGLIAALAVLAHEAIAFLQAGGAAQFYVALWQVAVIAIGMASLALILLPPRRIAFFLGFLVCAGLIGWALWLQYGEGLEPCPLCHFQRAAVAAIGLVFLVGTFHDPGRIGAWVYSLLLLLFAAIGGALALRQVWLQSLPKDQVPACGPGLGYMLDSMPFLDAITRVFEGSGECAEKGWVFLGLSIAGWTLAFFFTIAVAGIALARRD